LPGKTHELITVRVRGILHERRKSGILTLADKAYQGVGSHITAPGASPKLSTSFTAANSPRAGKRSKWRDEPPDLCVRA